MQTHAGAVLDLEELRGLTLNDRNLMREILWALIDDASRHVGMLETALRERDAARSLRIARSAARACANVGANAAAETFRRAELHAASRDLERCRSVLPDVRAEIERLRAEASRI